ncbi:MAG TPA: MarR family transcriptional regulator [Actinokineospora sp.]|nr:MarR family transcriptional regulator [Actinokineospora sp.]
MTDRVDELIASWRTELPAALGPTSELSKRVLLLAAELSEATRRETDRLGLTTAEFDVLVTLRRVGGPCRLKSNELSRSLLLSTGGTSNVVNRLADRGLVRRDPNPDDGRSALITLTEQGRALAEDAVLANTAAQEAVFAGVPRGALRAATVGLRAVIKAKDGR